MVKLVVNQDDLKQVTEVVRDELKKNNFMALDLIDVKLKNFKKEIVEELEVKMLVWKSEIITAVDSMAKEIRDEREFREIASHQIIELQKKVGVDV